MLKVDRKDKRENYIILAEYKTLEEDFKEAIENYKKALLFSKNQEERIFIFFRIALIYDETGDYLESINIYDRILKADKTQAGAYYGRAIAYEALGDFRKAEGNYLKAIEHNKDYDRAYYYLANLYDQEGDYESSIEYYYRLLDLVEDYFAYNNLAGIYEELGNKDKALNLINKSIELNPEFYQSRYNKGVILQKFKKLEEALDSYKYALELNPGYLNIYLNMSEIYLDQKNYTGAVDILSLGILNTRDNGDLHYNRACAYALLRRPEEALLDLEEAFRIDGRNKDYASRDQDLIDLVGLRDFQKLLEE